MSLLAPSTVQPAPRRAAHQIDPERARFYELLWGNTPGFVFVAAGLPASDVIARGWPLAADEQPSDPTQLVDKILMLLWTRTTGDAFKAAGRPHTGKVFAWPAEARTLDRYVARLSSEYDNVYCRPYVADTPEGAKRGDAPVTARIIRVEDAPADPGTLAPPYSFTLQTSAYSRQAFYEVPEDLPWHQHQRIATGLTQRLSADSGGPNAAQFTRVPTTRNTKAKAERYRVTLNEGAGPVALDTLARAALPGGLPELRSAAFVGDGRERCASKLHDPALWANLPDGAELMRTARYQALFTRRPQLAALAMGKRIALPTKYGIRDSGSEQVAVLVSNLLTTSRPGPDGTIVPGLGAPPEEEIRAVALYWRETLRPGCPNYEIDIDRLITEYRPVNYAPEPTTSAMSATAAPALRLLEEPRHKGRPAGQRSEQADRLLSLLADRVGQVVNTGDLARKLSVTDRMVREYLSDLRTAGVLETARTRNGLRVTRAEIKSEAPIERPAEAPEHMIAQIGNRPKAEALEYRSTTPENGDAAVMHENTPPRSGAAVSPCTAPECGIVAVNLLHLVEDAVAVIRATPKERLDTSTGEIVTYRPRPSLKAVMVLIRQNQPELTDAQIVAGWALYRDTWGRERERIAGLADDALLGAVRTFGRKLERARRVDNPRLGYWATLLTMAEGEMHRRGLKLIDLPKLRRPKQSREERKTAQRERAERLARSGAGLATDEETYRRHQLELWHAVDRHTGAGPVVGTGLRRQVVLSERREEPAGCVSPIPPTTALARLEGPPDGAAGMIARLRTRKAQQESALGAN